tara:strand:+ start:913 stop:1113 length:201 start_codon:yes stop_codon:yes gene_type:complete
MPLDAGACDFSASGLTVGRIDAAAVLGASPDTRTFSSLIVAVGIGEPFLAIRNEISRVIRGLCQFE